MAHLSDGAGIMTGRIVIILVGILVFVTSWATWKWMRSGEASPEAISAKYNAPLTPPPTPMRVYHLGHSLVGRDMPAMVAQLAGQGHRYESQLGWGTSLKNHWEGRKAINGFDVENDHPRYRAAKEAMQSGDYDAVVFTEMVEIKDAIKYHKSGTYLANWAELAREGRPDVRLYLYESWPRLDGPGDWLERLDKDLARYWEKGVLLPYLAEPDAAPVYIIPVGQVMARVVRAIEAGGDWGITRREDLFARNADGVLDPIHVNDLGIYLVALTHYAVLYHQSPVGLPYALRRADGSRADAPTPELARLMQEIVWDVVTSMPKTGVAPI